jgi:hypothetical protein
MNWSRPSRQGRTFITTTAAACTKSPLPMRFIWRRVRLIFDGNKRTGVEAALVLLEGSGIDASGLPEQQTYDLMIRIACHEAGRTDFADYLRSELGRARTPD